MKVPRFLRVTPAGDVAPAYVEGRRPELRPRRIGVSDGTECHTFTPTVMEATHHAGAQSVLRDLVRNVDNAVPHPHNASSLSDLGLICCGNAEIGQDSVSLSLNSDGYSPQTNRNPDSIPRSLATIA